MSDKRIFVTGGASGFGRALAERWARAGYKVLIGDIDEPKLAETKKVLEGHGATAHAMRCDVTKEEDFAAARVWLEENWGGVDVVVNNAGVAVGGRIEEVSIDDWRWIVDINLLGVVRGCRQFTPVFKKQGRGHFVNIASLAGLTYAPMMSAYNATKAAVVAISETLGAELSDDHIAVSVVCPSFFRTNIANNARSTSSPAVKKAADRLVNDAKQSADEIAEITFRSVQRGDFHVLPHAEGRAAWALKRALPFSVWLKILKNRAKSMQST